MMTRRGFLGRLATGLVGACAVAKIPTAWIPEPIRRYHVTFKRVPITYDAQCGQNTLYFFNRNGVYRIGIEGTRKL